MGVIKRGILGGFSGRVGSIVGTSWKGIAVIKSLPLSVANPRTAAQIAHRTDFKDTVQMAAKILSQWVKPLWDRFASRMSGYNAFVQENVDKYLVGTSNPFSAFVFSTGKMAGTALSPIAPAVGATEIVVDWVDDSNEGLKLSTDIAFVIVYSEASKTFTFSQAAATRADTEIISTIPAVLAAGEVYDIWLAFKRADGTVIGATSTGQTTSIA